MKKLLYISLATILLVACKNEKTINNDTAPEASKVETKKTPLQESRARGKSIYSKNCARCHLATGNGIPNSYPPLRKSDWFTKKRKESIHAVKYGLSGEITVNGKTYDNVMTPMGLSDQEVADVLNYAMNMWGNKQEKMVSSEEVSQVEK